MIGAPDGRIVAAVLLEPSARAGLLHRCAIALAIGALVFPVFLGFSPWLRDMLAHAYPAKLLLRQRWLAGELPLWNPYIGLGIPSLALVQPAVLYPGNLLLLLPVPLGVDLFFVAHFFVAAFGLRTWLRRTGSDDVAATFGGAVIAVSGYVVAMFATNGEYLVGISWVPWALAAAARPSSSVAAARIAVALALTFLGGDPQATFFAGLLCGVQALAAGGSRKVLASLATVAGAAALAALVCAVELLPAIEVARIGRPGGVSIDDARHFAVHPARLIELLWAGAFGDPHTPSWVVHALIDEGTGIPFEPMASSLYTGVATPFLALAAVVRRGRARLDWVLAAVAVVSALLALGPHLPLWGTFFRWMPGASQFRYPEKYFFVTTLSLCALGARGLGALADAPRPAMRIGAVIVLGLGAGAGLAALRGPAMIETLVQRLGDVSAEAAGENLARRALIAFAIAVAVWLALVLRVRGRLTASATRIAIGTIVVLDALVAALSQTGWAPSSMYRERSPVTADVKRAAAGDAAPPRLYRAFLLAGGAHGSRPEPLHASLRPDVGIEQGIGQLDGYTPLHPPLFTELRHALRGRPTRMLAITATRLALLARTQLGGETPIGMRLVAEYPELDMRLVELQAPAPRVYLAQHARAARDAEAAARAIADPAFVPGRDAVVVGAEDRDGDGACRLERYRPEELSLRCGASLPSYAVIADLYFPGWHAFVDGAEAPILPANVALRAVPVPAGESSVTLVYRPFGLRIGSALSALGILSIAVLVARRRRAAV